MLSLDIRRKRHKAIAARSTSRMAARHGIGRMARHYLTACPWLQRKGFERYHIRRGRQRGHGRIICIDGGRPEAIAKARSNWRSALVRLGATQPGACAGPQLGTAGDPPESSLLADPPHTRCADARHLCTWEAAQARAVPHGAGEHLSRTKSGARAARRCCFKIQK